MGSIEKIFNELKQTKEQMNYQEQELQFLRDRIDAIQRHHNKKMDQAKRIIKKLRSERFEKKEVSGQQLLG
tara:strand:+ start:47 stop:259 length:213 start_codon:yes stop_codon:yes gene_type:complete